MARDVATLLKAARTALAGEGIATPALDARLLLQKTTGLSHDMIVADPTLIIAEDAVARFDAALSRRLAREPVSRILGWREFYGRCFALTPAVLDPRPDTETLVDAALKLLPRRPRILDLGTGSGAIVVTLLAERTDARGVAVDLSANALAVSLDNALAHGVADRLELLQGTWFEPVTGCFDLIVSNPPYIPDAVVPGLEPEVRDHDPGLALAGGEDGLTCYRAISGVASSHLNPRGIILVEIGAGQAADVTAIFRHNGLAAAGQYRDLGGHVRCLGFVEESENTHWKSSAPPLNGGC